MKRTMVLLMVVEERDSEPPHYDAETTGAELDERSAVRQLPKPALAKCAAQVIPLFRRVAG